MKGLPVSHKLAIVKLLDHENIDLLAKIEIQSELRLENNALLVGKGNHVKIQ